MSFVSMVATEHFLSVVSDGRVIGHKKTPIQEDFQKFLIPRKDSIIAFAGGREPSLEFIGQSGLLDADTDKITDSEFAKSINRKLLSSPLVNYKIMLAFGGRSSKGKIAFHTFSSNEPKIQSFNPSGNDISFSFLHNGEDVNFSLGSALYENIESFGVCSPETTVKAQVKLNNRVALFDGSVNDNTFSHVILR